MSTALDNREEIIRNIPGKIWKKIIICIIIVLIFRILLYTDYKLSTNFILAVLTVSAMLAVAMTMTHHLGDAGGVGGESMERDESEMVQLLSLRIFILAALLHRLRLQRHRRLIIHARETETSRIV